MADTHILPCKAKRQYLLSCKVSRYCLLALQGSICCISDKLWAACLRKGLVHLAERKIYLSAHYVSAYVILA